MARYVAALPAVAWDNASQAILERSLDDSANRRLVHAEGFLAVDEIISRTTRIVREMTIDERAIRRNMIKYGPFAATERVLMALVTAGAGRQEGHEWMRLLSLQAWEAMQSGDENPLPHLLEGDERVVSYLTIPKIRDLMDSSTHTGTAELRATAFAETIRKTLEEYPLECRVN